MSKIWETKRCTTLFFLLCLVQPYMELLKWAPTGNAYLFVHRNNIYFR